MAPTLISYYEITGYDGFLFSVIFIAFITQPLSSPSNQLLLIKVFTRYCIHNNIIRLVKKMYWYPQE